MFRGTLRFRFLALAISVVAASPVASSPAEYAIVTSKQLAPEFEQLALWHAAHNLTAAVWTVEWITSHYSGIDDAEKVRHFIQDAYTSMGVAFVLLGGDAEIVPVRYVRSNYITPTDILCDYYFMCLDGTWNADGDQHFGEVEDGVDLLPEVFVGRAPVSTAAEAKAFVERSIAYQAASQGLTYPASALFLAERLGATHGASLAESTRSFIPSSFALERLYTEAESWPGAIPLTRQAAIDRFDAGRGFILDVGNGSVDSWGLGDSVLSIADVQALNNSPQFSVVYAFPGWTAAFDRDDAIGEHWLTSPGGAAAYVGFTNVTWLPPADSLIKEWVRRLFTPGGMHIGIVSASARFPLLDEAQKDGAARWMIFSLALLGDPALTLQTNTVTAVDSVTLAPVPAMALDDPTPSPFAAQTTIGFDFRKDMDDFELAIYDAFGRLRHRLFVGPIGRGHHSVRWSGETQDGEAPPGIYFVRLEANGIALSRKVVRIR